MIRVVCGIIYKNDKILLTRRKKGKILEGFWEFPGGTIEKSETEIEALQREIKEELGIKIFNIEYFNENYHQYENLSICLKAYKCITDEEPKKLTDHDMFKWCNAEEAGHFKFSPADIPILKKLIEE